MLQCFGNALHERLVWCIVRDISSKPQAISAREQVAKWRNKPMLIVVSMWVACRLVSSFGQRGAVASWNYEMLFRCCGKMLFRCCRAIV